MFLGRQSCFWESKSVFGKAKLFLGKQKRFWENKDTFGKCRRNLEVFKKERIAAEMVKKNFKGRCKKWKLEKCKEVMRAYSDIQAAYAEVLEQREEITEFQCNVMLEGLAIGDYSSDFVCVKCNGEWMVRECVERRFLTKPMTLKLLDASREYWLKHGVSDWGLVINAE